MIGLPRTVALLFTETLPCQAAWYVISDTASAKAFGCATEADLCRTYLMPAGQVYVLITIVIITEAGEWGSALRVLG